MEPHGWCLPGHGTSLGFFRFYAQSRRELLIQNEKVVSIDYRAATGVCERASPE